MAVLLVAAALTGCGGAYASSPGTPSGPETGFTALSIEHLAALTMPHYVARPEHPDRSASWMEPAAKSGKHLYYVSDWATDDVYVYKYPEATLLGKITGFAKPYGQCADADGNIWIADFGGASIVEYAHGGTTPIATLATNGTPIGCAVSAQGDLAVSNFSTTSGEGDIEVFAGESGTPTTYSSAACYNLWPPGYDKKGNLYVEAQTSGKTQICTLRAHGDQLKTTSIDQSIGSPGSIMWDGEYLAVTDQDYDATQTTAIYQASESKNTGSLQVVGTTQLTDTCHKSYADIPQPFVAGSRNTPVERYEATVVLGGNVRCPSRFAYWAYPWPSGNPIVVISNAPAQPYGVGYSTIGK